jgi:hypothetical protein
MGLAWETPQVILFKGQNRPNHMTLGEIINQGFSKDKENKFSVKFR